MKHTRRITRFLACLALALATPVTAATTAPGAAKMPELPPIAYSMEGNYLAGRFASQQSDYAASANYFAEALLSDPEEELCALFGIMKLKNM